MKTTPIPVKFDRQGHSCNFYVGFGPSSLPDMCGRWHVRQRCADMYTDTACHLRPPVSTPLSFSLHTTHPSVERPRPSLPPPPPPPPTPSTTATIARAIKPCLVVVTPSTTTAGTTTATATIASTSATTTTITTTTTTTSEALTVQWERPWAHLSILCVCAFCQSCATSVQCKGNSFTQHPSLVSQDARGVGTRLHTRTDVSIGARLTKVYVSLKGMLLLAMCHASATCENA